VVSIPDRQNCQIGGNIGLGARLLTLVGRSARAVLERLFMRCRQGMHTPVRPRAIPDSPAIPALVHRHRRRARDDQLRQLAPLCRVEATRRRASAVRASPLSFLSFAG